MLNIKIDNKQSGCKIDKFLQEKYKVSFVQLQKFFRNKDIKVNGKKVDSKYKLRAGDIVLINDFCENILANILDEQNKQNEQSKKNINYTLLEKVKQSIIFDDENLLVIDKPFGLSVQGGSGVKTSLDDLLPYLSNNKDEHLKLVHRLDRDTTGVLLIAKNQQVADLLSKQIRNKKDISKEYLAVVDGKFNNIEGKIELPLIKKYENNIEKVYVDKIYGKEATTLYKVIDYNEKLNISLVLVKILTGRTHQIRVHMKEIGHPIIGDFKYGKLSSKNISNVMLLHSYRTKLNFLGKKYNFLSKIPNNFLKLFQNNANLYIKNI